MDKTEKALNSVSSRKRGKKNQNSYNRILTRTQEVSVNKNMILENRGIKYGAIARILCGDKIISPQGGIRKKY